LKKSFFIGLMFLTIFSFSTWGQEIYRLYIKDINTGEELNINYKKTFVNTFQREKELNNIKMHFLDNGYLGFSVDSISGDSLNMSCIINPGLSYKWLILNTSLIEAGVLKKINFKHKNFDNKTINITSFNRLKEGILSYYENNGYPFAEVGLDSIIIEQNNVKAWLIADKKQLILFDTIVLTGNGEIKKTFLENYIGIKKNNVYSESQDKILIKS